MYDRPRKRKMIIVAEDPSFLVKGKILTASVEVPVEPLAPGPVGSRVQVIDYDSSTKRLYKPRAVNFYEDANDWEDPKRLLNDPTFHQQNVYAIAMATLARFEQALGRRVAWNFPGGSHQLKIAPHAFLDANAYYSPRDEAVFFGYFRGSLSGNTVYTCLSHNVVAHEVTHALVDGLLPQYMCPRSPDQFAFHEAFADIVALLSVLSAFDGVIDVALAGDLPTKRSRTADDRLIHEKLLRPEKLRHSFLTSLAEQVGTELAGVRGQPLRQPTLLTPRKHYLSDREFMEPHRRGEVLVAAMLNAFTELWWLATHFVRRRRKLLERKSVINEGRAVAERLLLASIRALDYTPPVLVTFGDFLSGLLTADTEVHPSDSKYFIRKGLRKAFGEYGITPSSKTNSPGSLSKGAWPPVQVALSYRGLHFDAMQIDQVEMFKFLWQNRKALDLTDTRTYVQSVRPVQRVSEEGFLLREVVANYVQVLDLTGGELRRFGFRRPPGMSANHRLRLYGGGSLVFDSYGQLRFHVQNPVVGPRQQASLEFLWERGASVRGLNLSALHRTRGDITTAERKASEQW